MKNLSESILYNIHKSEEINKKQLKLFEESGVIDDFLSRKLDTICNEVRISRQTIPMDVDWKPAGENSFYIMPEINDYTSEDEDEDDWEEILESLEDTIMDVATKYFPEAEVYKEGNWYLLKLDEDDFLDESVSRNPRKVSKNVNARRIKESENLTARVTYHSEDGTRDYIAGRLSDGRYFLIGQQEQITVSDKDLPRLAKKDMDDFRYDEDGDKEFIEALENGTKLDKNSDLAKIIINASRKHLDDGCYLLSESARRIKENNDLIIKSRRKAKKLNEGEKYSYITGANDYEDVYNSEANTDVLFILKELERYFNESSEFVKNMMSSDEAINYQFPSGEANMLKQSADKIAEVRNAIDKWYSEKY